MTRTPTTIALLSSLVLSFPAVHGETERSPEKPLEQTDPNAGRMEELRERLQLTDEQFEKVRVILRGNIAKLREVLRKHNIERGAELSRQQRNDLAKDLRPIRQESDRQFAGVLTPEQMREFEKIRQEARERSKARRKPQSN